MIDYENKTEGDLESIIVTVKSELDKKKKRRKQQTLNDIYSQLSTIDLSFESSTKKTNSTLKGMKLPPKYINPLNHEQHWSGRGLQPDWMKKLITDGVAVDDLKI